MYSEQARKLIEQVRANRCNRKGCLSQQRDPLDTVWFGQQYGECREFTCSACFVCNDEAIKAAIPTTHNVLPVRYDLPYRVSSSKGSRMNSKLTSKGRPARNFLQK